MEKDFIPGTELIIKQNRNKFSFGTDAVMLSDFAGKAERLIDLGCGTGILLLRMLGLNKAKSGVGIELDEDETDIGIENILINNLSEKAEIMQGDYMRIEEYFGREEFDMAIANPPYFKASPIGKHSSARHEINMDFNGLTRAANYLLKDCGYFIFSHTPQRIPEIFKILSKYNFEPKRMQLVEPKEKPAATVLIEARKNVNEGMKFEKTVLL